MPKSTALAKKQPKPFVRKRKPEKVKLEQQVQMFVIQRKDGPDIMLPLDTNENRKLMQIEAAKFVGTIDLYERSLGTQGVKDLTPGQLKQLGEAKKIAQELSFAAWDRPDADDPKAKKDDDFTGLISQAVSAGMDVQKKQQELAERNKPIDAEVEDVKD